jgi:hypothetical protein
LANYPNRPASGEEMLDALQRGAFGYFLHETNPANGLVADKTQPDTPRVSPPLDLRWQYIRSA